MRFEYFQLIDRIVELDLNGQVIKAEANVPATSTVFEGHFPGRPLMPGVLLIEAMAQTSGWLLIALTKFERMPFLAAVKDAKLRAFVGPNEQINITANILHEGSGFAMTKASIEVAGKLACSATLTFSMMQFPSPDLRGYMEAMARVLGLPQQVATNG